jgi:hypothetical protein
MGKAFDVAQAKLPWLAPLALLLSVSCSPQPAAPALPPFQATVPMHDLMESMFDPAADVIWESVGTIVTKEGTFDKAPQTDEEWDVVRAAAIALGESGNLLMLPSRSGGSDEWVKLAQAMTEQSLRAKKAAEAKDKDALFNIGADIYESCVNCHKRFHPEVVKVK